MSALAIDIALRGAALVLVALGLAALLRRAAPRTRGNLLLATLFGLVLLPVATWLLPCWAAPVLAPAAGPDTPPTAGPDPTPASPRVRREPDAAAPTPRATLPRVPAERVGADAPEAADEETDATSTPGLAAPASAPTFPGWLPTTWAIGSLLVLLTWGVGVARAAYWHRGSRPVPASQLPVDPGIPVAVHPRVPCPLTVGIFRPAILLPTAAISWTTAARHAAILHEAEHSRRHDVPAQAVARLACALHWFNPLVWLASSRLRHECELACDEAVLRSGMRPTTFASLLVDLARESRGPRLHGAVAGWASSGLERRIEEVLRDPGPRAPRHRYLGVAGALAVAFLVVATLTPTHAVRAEDEPASETDTQVVTVGGADADHTTIQAAVDAAAPGATIRIAAGTYEEPVDVAKPLTLEGAGWTETRIVTALKLPVPRGQQPPPTLRVHDTGPVVLRGLRLAMTGTRKEGQLRPGFAVVLSSSRVQMEDCAVVPSPAGGVSISGAADVVLQRCLVAAIGSTGIAVRADDGRVPEVRILESDVRYGYHRCITIGRGCDDVLVEGCRIRGSGWHGIRYDSASPVIRRNRITDNVRSGIYASGRTTATVEGNLFADTGLGGVSCWYDCNDRIERNTFAHNAREGLAILGRSEPTVLGNVFVDHPVAVRWSGQSGGHGSTLESTFGGALGGNLFWDNGVDLASDVSSDPTSVTLDPRLSTTYELPEDSPARAKGLGALDLPPATSPFPAQPEEAAAARTYQEQLAKYGSWKRVQAPSTPSATPSSRSPVPRPDGALERHAREQRRAGASTLSQEWLTALRGLRKEPNAEKRETILAEIREALGGDDPTRLLAGLYAARWLEWTYYDPDAFRALIVPYVHAGDPFVRRAARDALVRVKPDPADLPMWLEEARVADRSNAETTAESIVLLADGVLEGPAADAVLHLLRDGTDINKAFVIRGLANADVFDPRVERRLIEIVRSVPAHDYDSAYYFHFITPKLDPKSDAVLEVMIERMEEGKTSLRTLLQGLHVGLTSAQREHAADRLLAAAEARLAEGKDPRHLLEGAPGLVDGTHVEALERLRASADLSDAARTLVERALASIEHDR